MNKLTHKQIAKLVVRAQEGDQEAFAALYTATVDRQLYFATAFLKDSILAEDVVQDVYIKIFRSIHKLINPMVFVAYLNRICYNTCVDYRKKQQTQKYELDDESLLVVREENPTSLPADHFDSKELNSELYGAISQLSDDQRAAFLLRHYDNYKIKEIAEIMNISESTVKRYVKSATQNLKQLLANKIEMEVT